MVLPDDFFTLTTFSTLAGCSLVVYVVTGVVAYMLNSNNLELKKWLSFVLSFVVAFIGVLFIEHPIWSSWVMAFFNGFLIFATTIGGNTILSSTQQTNRPISATTFIAGDKRTATNSSRKRRALTTHLFKTRWV